MDMQLFTLLRNRGSADRSHEGRNGGKIKLIPSSWNAIYRQEKATHLCTELSSLCWITTVLEGLFGEYHSSSAALGQQHQEVTKQPLYVIGW